MSELKDLSEQEFFERVVGRQSTFWEPYTLSKNVDDRRKQPPEKYEYPGRDAFAHLWYAVTHALDGAGPYDEDIENSAKRFAVQSALDDLAKRNKGFDYSNVQYWNPDRPMQPTANSTDIKIPNFREEDQTKFHPFPREGGQFYPNDLTEEYNTNLGDQEPQFQKWAREQQRMPDLFDYDLRGYWKEYQPTSNIKDEHLTDKYKKPNHQTFSDESIYHGVDGHEGGAWIPMNDDAGSWLFMAGKSNMQYHSKQDLEWYFSKAEPDSAVFYPQ